MLLKNGGPDSVTVGQENHKTFRPWISPVLAPKWNFGGGVHVFWLVVDLPFLKNVKVSWNYSSQYMGTIKIMFQTTKQFF